MSDRYSTPNDKPGLPYDIRKQAVLSFAAEGDIQIGAPVRQVSENGVLSCDGSSCLGIALVTPTITHDRDSYEAGDVVPVLSRGACYIKAGADGIVPGQRAFVNSAGLFTNSSNEAVVIGRFITGGDTDELVVVELTGASRTTLMANVPFGFDAEEDNGFGSVDEPGEGAGLG